MFVPQYESEPLSPFPSCSADGSLPSHAIFQKDVDAEECPEERRAKSRIMKAASISRLLTDWRRLGSVWTDCEEDLEQVGNVKALPVLLRVGVSIYGRTLELGGFSAASRIEALKVNVCS